MVILVTNYSGEPMIQGLVVFSPTRFAVYGRRIQFYNTTNSEKKTKIQKSALRSISSQALIQWRSRFFSSAIDCVFCDLLQYFVALTKDSLRVYSSKNGRLQKYIDFADKDKNELTCIAANQQHKHIYVGNTIGCIAVYNAVTFQHITTIQSLDKHINPTVCLHSFNFLASVTASDTVRVINTKALVDVKVSRTADMIK